jgi:hypothetical protein
MRRVLASLLLALFSFPLIAVVFASDSASQVPACCRRDGAHRCSMLGSMMGSMMDGGMESPGPAFQAIRPKCPFYPSTTVSPAETKVAIPRSYLRIFGSSVCSQVAAVRAESRSCISFNRSHQKRGPPA